jgi:hypothetical protein
MTDQEKAGAVLRAYELDVSTRKALTVDIITLLRNEREERTMSDKKHDEIHDTDEPEKDLPVTNYDEADPGNTGIPISAPPDDPPPDPHGN